MSSLYSASPMTGPTGKVGNKVPSGYKLGQIQQFNPQQMELFQQLFGNVAPESFLSQIAGGDETAFNELENPALKQFSALQGNIASRFSGAGSGARRSSGFQNSMNSAAQDFAGQLQAQRLGLRKQALQDLMGFSNQLLNQRPYENFLNKKENKEPFWKQLLGVVSPGGGDIASGDTQNTQNFFQTLMSMGG